MCALSSFGFECLFILISFEIGAEAPPICLECAECRRERDDDDVKV